MEHKYLYHQNKKVHYQDEGSGNTTLVLLHGFMNSLDVWASYVYAYMRHFRVVTIDLPGHGKTANFAEVHSMDLMAETVKAVLDHLRIEQCVMIGHSMGGYVTASFAEKYPFMLKGFGFLHSHVMKDDEETKRNRYRTCQIAIENRANFIINFIPNLFNPETKAVFLTEIENLQEAALAMSIEGIVAAQEGMAERQSRVETLIQAKAPVLFIFGKKDTRVPLELGISIAMLPKHSEILLLENVAHMGHIEARKVIKNQMKSFVENCFSGE